MSRDVTVVLILLAAAAAAIAVLWAVHTVKLHGLGPVLWRFFSGHALDGKHRTNATWSRPATKVLHPTGHAVRWHHWPRRRRLAIRTGTVASLAGLAYGLLTARRITLAALAAVVITATLYCSVWSYFAVLRWNHRRKYVGPLGYALAGIMGVPPASLSVAPDRSRVVLALPEGFTGADGDKEAITRAVTAKLAIEAPDAQWTTSRKDGKPQVVFTASQPPPARVTAAGILPEIATSKPHEVVVGIGRKHEVIRVSVDDDSPHIGLSMISGDGKSTVAKNFLCQQLHHGALGLVLDYKLISHQWARGLPNVAYAGTPEEITTLLLWLEKEIARRNKVALAGADIEGEVHSVVGPRLFVIAEELNATQGKLRKYWRNEMGGKGPAPAADALDEALFIGRQVLANILMIGQKLSAKATSGSGSGDGRECLGVKLFCDPSASVWKMLGCEDLVRPPAAGHRGRILVVTRREVRDVQGAFWTGKEARDFALSGTIATPRHDMPLIRPALDVPGLVPGDQSSVPTGPDQPFVLGQCPDVLAPSGAVTLAEACAAGLLHRSKTAAQRASTRDPGHPEPVGKRGTAHLYDIDDLYAYEARKARVA